MVYYTKAFYSQHHLFTGFKHTVQNKAAFCSVQRYLVVITTISLLCDATPEVADGSGRVILSVER